MWISTPPASFPPFRVSTFPETGPQPRIFSIVAWNLPKKRFMQIPSDASQATPPETPRSYGPWTGTFVVISSMVGAGILTSSGYTLRDTGNPFSLLLLWSVGGLIALFGAWCIAEMSTALPRSGGDYVLVREAFGWGAGVVAGWATFLLGFAAPTAVVALLAAEYAAAPLMRLLDYAEPPTWLGYAKSLGASVLILIIGLVHCLGRTESSFFQGATTVAKLVTLAALALVGIGFGTVDWNHFSGKDWPSSGEWQSLSTGLIYVSYAYIGWNGAAYIAGEIRNPGRNLPLALVGGCLIVTGLYLLMNLFYVLALDPLEMMKKSPAEVGPIAELATREALGPSVSGWVSAFLGLGLIASVSAFLLTGPRVAMAMARDGAFPRFAGVLHPTWQTPARATLCQVVLSSSFCWSGSFLQVLDYTSVGLTAVSALVVSSIFPLRRRKDLTPTFRVPGHPLPALFLLGLSAWTILAVVADPKTRIPAVLSLATIALGIPLGWRFGSKASQPSQVNPPA